MVLLFTGCATVDQKSWEKARQMDSFESYGDYIKSNPLGAHVGEARAKIAKSYTLDDHEVEQLARLQKDNPIEAKRALYVDKLIFTAAACLDMQANWVYPVKGRKLYDMLKKYDSQTLGDSMTRVVLIHIDRLRVLFLIVKLGISGTQSTLNSLLMRYGDKGMAEDFLNSGSGELHSGGSDWARAHGYRIRSGPGSHRVGWGRF
ncbi:MAG: hypothetical protein PHT44_03960 [Candidatus Portnoybacteria bacterium]|nr:hypothetical protein [Candidatus Portnoybacteria bacterium]MDD4983019.1 hypothetical protein [Candidatus Portnoybacteria bacterium]